MSAPSSIPSSGQGVATDSVSIKDFAFAPGTVTVKVGATVTWTNSDQEPHTVTSSGSGGPLRSPTMKTGDTYRYMFTTPGRYEYLCTIHPFMTAMVVVTP
jgi:amicyanin